MRNELPPDELKALWQSQKPKEFRMSLDEIRTRAEGIRKRVRRRTVLGLATVYFLIVCLVIMFFWAPNVVTRIGSFLTALACAYMAYQLQTRRGESLAAPPTGVTGLTAYRTELERQRDFHRGKWFWSRLLILLPSYLILLAGLAIAFPQFLKELVVIAAIAVLLGILAVRLNRQEAHRYQRRIVELEGLEK